LVEGERHRLRKILHKENGEHGDRSKIGLRHNSGRRFSDFILSSPSEEIPMLLIREIMHCKPGKVRALVEKFLAMSKLNEKAGMGKIRVMTDFCGERYWTIVSDFEVENMERFEKMMQGEGMTPEMTKEFEKIMEGYHDLVDDGRREIFKIEG
jgi:hypothetical protein